MGVNTHKIVLLFFVINLVISFVTGMYSDPDVFTEGVRKNITNEMRNTTGQYTDNFDDPDDQESTQTTNLQSETSFGSSTSMGRAVWNAMAEGFIKDLAFADRREGETQLESILWIIISLFRWAMAPLIVLEIYMVIKNKKTN